MLSSFRFKSCCLFDLVLSASHYLQESDKGYYLALSGFCLEFRFFRSASHKSLSGQTIMLKDFQYLFVAVFANIV